MNAADRWVGNSERSGNLQRIGIAFMVLSVALVFLTFTVRLTVSTLDAMFNAAGWFLYSGFIVAAIADLAAERRFSFSRLVILVFLAFTYGQVAHLVISAAVPAQLA